MRIVVVVDWFSEQMGYAENFLPKALAELGAQVHVITSNAQVYFDAPLYKETYEPYLGPGVVDCGVKELDGYTLHRLPFGRWRGRLRIRGLVPLVRSLRPDIVQTFDTQSVSTYEITLAKPTIGYKVFHESHMHASVFTPIRERGSLRSRFHWLVYAATVGRVVSMAAEACYPISTDASDIAIQFYGFQPRKISICSLGVDTELFVPAHLPSLLQERQSLREQLGFAEDDVVCVYTGRFSEDKGPVLLAQAVSRLVGEGTRARGLFIGSGAREDVEAINSYVGCVTHHFVPTRDLPAFYRAADIGVWPKQESTSQLDAAACGLPLVLSNRIQVRERADGNGLLYAEGDPADLAKQIAVLCEPVLRRQMGQRSVQKMRESFSWRQIAKERLSDYEAALRR